MNLSKFKLKQSWLVLMLFTFISGGLFAQDAATEERTAASLYNEGLGLLKEKNYEQGLTLMEQALEKATADENDKIIKLAKKNSSKASYNLAKSKYKAKDYDGALALYQKGISYDSTNVSNYTGVANVLRKQDKGMESVDMFITAANMYKDAGKDSKINSIMKKLNVMVGKAYTSDKFDFAIEAGTKALAVADYASLAYYVSRAQLEKKEYQAALDMANKAIETGKANDEMEDKYYIAQAMALVGLGKKGEAIKAYEMVKDDKYLEQAQYQITQLKG